MPDEAGLSDIVDYQTPPLKQSNLIALKPVRSRVAASRDTGSGYARYGRENGPVICRAATGRKQTVDRRCVATSQPVGPETITDDEQRATQGHPPIRAGVQSSCSPVLATMESVRSIWLRMKPRN